MNQFTDQNDITDIVNKFEKKYKKNIRSVNKYNNILKELNEMENTILTDVKTFQESQNTLHKMICDTQDYFFIITRNCID